MSSLDEQLDELAADLYGLPPTEFTAARDSRVAELRAQGDRPLADAVKRLRRPTVSAWVLNLLARERADVLDDLIALGDSLREAADELQGDELRALSRQRQQVVQALVRDGERLARSHGVRVDADTSREVQETLAAALADPAVAADVRAGRLERVVRYGGFGSPDPAPAGAVPPAATARPSRDTVRSGPRPAAPPGEAGRR
jgi:hypothetical protein